MTPCEREDWYAGYMARLRRGLTAEEQNAADMHECPRCGHVMAPGFHAWWDWTCEPCGLRFQE